MKRYIKNTEQFEELHTIECMSRINPQLCENLQITVDVVQGGEGPIPHVHVYHDKNCNPKKCSYVRLDVAEYSTHHKYNIPLPSKLKKQFIEVMTSIWRKYFIETPSGLRPATGYEAAVNTWVDTYEHGDYSKFTLDEKGELIPPDYSQL